MTDLDKQAACREVYLAMGRKILSEHTIPNLFAHSAAGALALLESEEWLLNTRKFDYSTVTRYANGLPVVFGIYFEDELGNRSPEGCATTLAEARALAICNAVRGMREDKNG